MKVSSWVVLFIIIAMGTWTISTGADAPPLIVDSEILTKADVGEEDGKSIDKQRFSVVAVKSYRLSSFKQLSSHSNILRCQTLHPVRGPPEQLT